MNKLAAPAREEVESPAGLAELMNLMKGSGRRQQPVGGADDAALLVVITTLAGVVGDLRAELRWWRDRYMSLEERYEQSRDRGA